MKLNIQVGYVYLYMCIFIYMQYIQYSVMQAGNTSLYDCRGFTQYSFASKTKPSCSDLSDLISNLSVYLIANSLFVI